MGNTTVEDTATQHESYVSRIVSWLRTPYRPAFTDYYDQQRLKEETPVLVLSDFSIPIVQQAIWEQRKDNTPTTKGNEGSDPPANKNNNTAGLFVFPALSDDDDTSTARWDELKNCPELSAKDKQAILQALAEKPEAKEAFRIRLESLTGDNANIPLYWYLVTWAMCLTFWAITFASFDPDIQHAFQDAFEDVTNIPLDPDKLHGVFVFGGLISMLLVAALTPLTNKTDADIEREDVQHIIENQKPTVRWM